MAWYLSTEILPSDGDITLALGDGLCHCHVVDCEGSWVDNVSRLSSGMHISPTQGPGQMGAAHPLPATQGSNGGGGVQFKIDQERFLLLVAD